MPEYITKSFSPRFSFPQDPTAAHYMFHDDPYLMPKNSATAVSISFEILDSFLIGILQ